MHTFKYLFLTFFTLSFSTFAAGKIPSISILTNANNLKSTVARFAIEDCLSLLQKACQCDVQLNNTNAQILIELPNISLKKNSIEDALKEQSYSPNSSTILNIENANYSWYSQRIDDGILLQLQAQSYEGISNGLYGLLQEQLWFSFYHPIETHIPTLNYWPLSDSFYWHANTRFELRGFQLNTLQQIELTNALLDPSNAEAESQLIQYIDWLARNGQNHFEFIISNKIDTLNWHNYIQGIIDYSHARGIKIGLSFSFDKKAEAAYKITKNKWYKSSKKKQAEIAKNLHPICKNNWDIINIFWERDYGKSKKINKRQALGTYAHKYIDSSIHAAVIFQYNLGKNIHITKLPDSINLQKNYALENIPLVNLEKNKEIQNSLSQIKNVPHIFFIDRLSQGIGFDHTQPFLLLSYLSTIWDNIQYNYRHNSDANISKSNGWEWGYWIMDWSTARWNWKHTYNEQPYSMEATQYLGDIFKRERIANLFAYALQLQDSVLIKQNLMSYLVLDTLGEKYPKALSEQIIDTQIKKVKWLHKKASIEEINAFNDSVIKPLMQLAKEFDLIVNALAKEEILIQDIQLRALLGEFIRAIKVSGLRAKHKAYLLEYVASKRLNKLTNNAINEAALQKAIQARQEALTYINLQSFIYRYDKNNISAMNNNLTAYKAGYLAATNDLHLWQKEEEMYKKGKYKSFKRQYLNVKNKLGS